MSNFHLTPEILEEEILKQHILGNHVKGFIFCNPNNPLGVVFSKELMLSLMRVCAKYNVHFISDEIYGLSVFDPTAKFDSILSIPKEKVRAEQRQQNLIFLPKIPDPERTHFLWGLSKDFSLAGLRIGFIHSYNTDLMKCLDGMKFYTSVSVHIQEVFT